jgi:ABC-type multidrug transport system permease subunit
MEPTGHYWLSLAGWLKNKAIEAVLVNPHLVKKNRENRDNSRSKSDRKDALVIADMVKNGYYSPVRFHSSEYEELRVLMANRETVYVNYLLPGILLIAIVNGISYTAFRLFTDVQRGIFERLHSMPISRSTLLWGHVMTSLVSNAISVVVIILVALIMGSHSSAGILSWLAVAGILALFTLTLTWVAAIAGLSAKSVDGASAFSYPIIFLPLIS